MKKRDLNFKTQNYKGLKLNLLKGNHSVSVRATQFYINYSKEKVWIPNSHLKEDKTLKDDQNIDYVFSKNKKFMEVIKCANQKKSNRW